ncbi:MAG: cation transporter [Bacteroidales bacterium]|nr:cation transporter [Bacteroidales bacterium]MBN2755765.1 cation transporter [Bacteroidales bacterium]
MHSHSQHNHNHHHHSNEGKNLFISIILNVLITVFQIIGSFISGSLALLTDALHNLSDVIALIISFIANKLSERKNTKTKTFGFKRAEIIAAFINASSLILIAIFLIIEAFKRLITDENTFINAKWVIALAAFSILANGLSVILLHKQSKGNLNIKSAYLHLFTDMLSSIAVLIGGFLILFYDIFWVDSVLTVFIGFYLLFSAWNIFLDSLKILMQFTPSEINLDKIKSDIEKITEINNIHHVHIWQLNDKQINFECHVNLCKDLKISETETILSKIEEILIKKYQIEHNTVQFEFESCKDNSLIFNDIRKC